MKEVRDYRHLTWQGVPKLTPEGSQAPSLSTAQMAPP